MPAAHEILAHMPAEGECSTVEDLSNATGIDRKRVAKFCDTLVRNKLATRQRPGCFLVTAAGARVRDAGTVIKSGPKRSLTGQRQPKDTLRQRAWNAMHRLEKFTAPDLAALAARGQETDANGNVSAYLRKLSAVGVVGVLPIREPGTAMTSNGFKRYRLLIADLGPLSPTVRHDGSVFDRNAKRVLGALS